MKLNNVDKAVSPKPAPDVWAEPTEPTYERKVPSLIKGPTADKLYSAAHAAAAALRKLRRQVRRNYEPDDIATDAFASVDKQPKGNPPRMGYCSECRGYVSTEERHLQCEKGRPTEFVTEEPEQITAYHNRLWEATQMAKGRRAPQRPRKEVAPEWRQPPGYPNYVLHSVTRKLWRQSYEITLSNGNTRRYPAKEVKAVNGSYSLSVNGVKTTRGVNVLWALTFPEYARKRTTLKKLDGEWAKEVHPRRNELDDVYTGVEDGPVYGGLGEWLGGGGVGVETRPK